LEAVLSFGNSPGNGTLELHPNGSFHYTPHPGFSGDDRFSYYLDDGYSYSALVPVNIRVGWPLGLERGWVSDGDGWFKIYPNPGEDLFYLSSSRTFMDAFLRIIDMTGREITSMSLVKSTTEINLSDVEPGMYIFNISVGNHTEIHRIVKN
jgi:hypothetical protein